MNLKGLSILHLLNQVGEELKDRLSPFLLKFALYQSGVPLIQLSLKANEALHLSSKVYIGNQKVQGF